MPLARLDSLFFIIFYLFIYLFIVDFFFIVFYFILFFSHSSLRGHLDNEQ